MQYPDTFPTDNINTTECAAWSASKSTSLFLQLFCESHSQSSFSRGSALSGTLAVASYVPSTDVQARRTSFKLTWSLRWERRRSITKSIISAGNSETKQLGGNSPQCGILARSWSNLAHVVADHHYPPWRDHNMGVCFFISFE